MSEFKITYKTTLCESQEYCENQGRCTACPLKSNSLSCEINYYPPLYWGIKKPKTYLEDFLEKFPNTSLSDDYPIFCREAIYTGCDICPSELTCFECWNQPMEEKNE